ncbi:MAG TPA: hypothetical protein VFZ65_23740 [Planctomycetota bacterium]|nr:hypothetical protein [Planctomycetota bacterium]
MLRTSMADRDVELAAAGDESKLEQLLREAAPMLRAGIAVDPRFRRGFDVDDVAAGDAVAVAAPARTAAPSADRRHAALAGRRRRTRSCARRWTVSPIDSHDSHGGGALNGPIREDPPECR